VRVPHDTVNLRLAPPRFDDLPTEHFSASQRPQGPRSRPRPFSLTKQALRYVLSHDARYGQPDRPRHAGCALLHGGPASLKAAALVSGWCQKEPGVLPALISTTAFCQLDKGNSGVGLPGLEPGTSSLSETKACVVDVRCCSVNPAKWQFFDLQLSRAFAAVQGRCRQTVVNCRRACVARSSPPLRPWMLSATRTCDLLIRSQVK
jgi:hypothetical protein